MNDLLEIISDLKELETLYQSGELREFDFRNMISKYESQFTTFETQMEDLFEADAKW